MATDPRFAQTEPATQGETAAGEPAARPAPLPGAGAVGIEPAEPTGPSPEAEDHEEHLQRDLEELAARAQKADEYLELAQRTQADFENYRKRAARDAAAARERGVVKLVRELLPALDNLDRALAAAPAAAGSPSAVGSAATAGPPSSVTPAVATGPPPAGGPPAAGPRAAPAEATENDEAPPTLVAGIKLVHDDVLAALARVGIERFSPEGEAFDPQYHEAVAQQPMQGASPGTIVEVYQRGYRLGDSVLRPARVLVAG